MNNAASTPEFRWILQELYKSGRYKSSGEVLSKAWKVYRARQHQPESVQQRRYAMRKTAEGMNPRKPIVWRYGKKGHAKRSTLLQYQKEEQETPEITYVDGKLSWLKSHGLTSWAIENPRPPAWRRAGKKKSRYIPEKVRRAHFEKAFPERDFDKFVHRFDDEKPRKRRRKNPIAVYNPKRRLTKLPATQIEMRYKRTNGKYAGKFFKHSFKGGASLFGMPDGSLLLKSSSGRKLWGTV